MNEPNEALRVVPELYFLIAKFLSTGPFKETAKTLLKELESVEVLPRRLDWEGNEHTQSYEDLSAQHSDLSSDRLVSICDRALRLAKDGILSCASTPHPDSISLPGITASPPSPLEEERKEKAKDIQDKVTARLSLLSESLVRPKPLYASYKEDHSIVRRVTLRELGLGAASRLGVGGTALMPPRMLCGLRLQRRTLGHLSAVYCLVFDCTGRFVITGADDLLVKVWSAEDGRLLRTLRGAGAEITDVCVSSDGQLLAAGSVERLVRVWCLATGAPVAVLGGQAGTITAVHWSPRRWLAATATDGSVAFWQRGPDGAPLAPGVRLVERGARMLCAAWSPGGALLAAGGADRRLRLYRVGESGPRRVLDVAAHADAVDSVAWAHHSARLVSGGKDGTCALWSLQRGCWRRKALPYPATRLKVTMVCWDRSDAFILTAVSDNTIRVWCSRTCTQISVLRGHSGEAYVLEAHPFIPRVALSAAHDGRLIVWHLPHGALAAFRNEPALGDGAIFDAKWGGACRVAATDAHGHLLLLGLGQGHPLLGELPNELFFHSDYRPLVRDALGGALDEQTELPPHLMGTPILVDVSGAPHPPSVQRHVPYADQDLFEEFTETGEDIRRENYQPGAVGLRPLLPPLSEGRKRALAARQEEMLCQEMSWYRREMRKRPLMISTAPSPPPRRRVARTARPPTPQIHEEPPEPDSVSGSDDSDSSVRLSVSASGSQSGSERSSAEHPTSDSSSSSSSQYSDWREGPPVRSRRRPVPTKRYSPAVTKRVARSEAANTGGGSALPTAGTAPPNMESSADAVAAPVLPGGCGDVPEEFRVGDWLTAVSPRKAPYHPQMGDDLLYFRLGHQRYFEAVAEKDLYKVNPRDKPWERAFIHECEAVTVVGIKYVIRPPRLCCLRLQVTGSNRCFTVRYHDMADVIDFLVLRQQYDTCVARKWGPGDRFRCMIDDSWWTGVIIERVNPPSGSGGGAGPEAGASAGTAAEAEAALSAAAAPHFLSLRVRWDNGEVERLSPWDLEPLDPLRLPSEPGGSVPVLPHELEAVLYKASPHEWPPDGDRPAACRAIALHVSQVMTLSAAEPFVAPVDMARYPQYARTIAYPIDLATVRARFDSLFYRRAAAAQFDVRYLASNAEQFNLPHSIIVRQARLLTDLLLAIISEWRSVDVLLKYRELAASYHSDDENSSTPAQGLCSTWQEWCTRVLRELTASPDAEPFLKPVSLQMAPDYLSVVRSPMDLGTIRSRLSSGRYARKEHFLSDVRRVFANSRLYNTNRRSLIYNMTVRLSALFESLWSRTPDLTAAAGSSAAAGPSGAPRRRPPTRTKNKRLLKTTKQNGTVHHPQVNGFGSGSDSDSDNHSDSDSSSSSSDGEPLAAASRRQKALRDAVSSGKGKGVGKKSKNTLDEHPIATSSRNDVLAEAGPSWAPESDSGESSLTLPHHQRGHKRQMSSDSGWRSPQDRRKRNKRIQKRIRERFTTASSSDSSTDDSDKLPIKYRFERSTDDDEPLQLYRQRREEGTSEDNRHPRNVERMGTLGPRPRRVPRRAYREHSQSGSDSTHAISKRTRPTTSRHHQRAALHSDHDYLNGHSRSIPPVLRNGESTPLSISSRGRVRKLTPKARGLFRE
ncbi:hypothetical protein ACJJTC_019199 [Scirpophaga incertulas]